MSEIKITTFFFLVFLFHVTMSKPEDAKGICDNQSNIDRCEEPSLGLIEPVPLKSSSPSSSSSSSSELVIFSYSSPFTDKIREDKRFFTFFGQNVTMMQKWAPGGKGGSSIGFGCSVYDGSFLLAEYLERHAFEFLLGKKIVEIGSGPGLISVASSLGNADLVCCTDGDEIAVALAEENLKINCNKKTNFVTKRLLWGDQADIDGVLRISGSKYDVIVASDVAALPYEKHYSNLVETLHQLCHSGSRLLLCYQRRHSSESNFFELLKTKFIIQKVSRLELHSDFRDKPIILYSGTPIF
jgi:predicted nicotinamide N-methyase